jgi:CRISPR-associated endoribonuclease Cas6
MPESMNVPTLRRVELTVRPTERFPVPESNGYSVYGALLSALERSDGTASAHVHDSPLGSLHNSGLRGVFADADRPHHRSLLPDETYSLTLGVVDEADTEIFQALVDSLVFGTNELSLSHGTLTIDSLESSNITHNELLERAEEATDPLVVIRFDTATCIKEGGDVTAMFPHREPVFRSLSRKWNQTAPEAYEVSLSRETLRNQLFEKPNAGSYDTHSVLVNRVKNEQDETRNIFRQGFTGECAYGFKNASESVKNAVTALALFGEYSGVGTAVSRGCGHVRAEIK